jgi:[ribosomal protein S5]-alanine N-acetyltransferase
MIRLETERLIVRNFKVNDCEALHEMIVQYEVSEVAAYDQQWPTSAEEIKGITEWFASGDNFLAVCLKDTTQFIGFVALNPEEGEQEYNIGYVFNSKYHGHGYATEACTAILDRAFSQLQAARVITGTAALNQSSCRLLERLGFQKVGEKVSSFKNAEDGTPIEFLGYIYAMSKEKWENR